MRRTMAPSQASRAPSRQRPRSSSGAISCMIVAEIGSVLAAMRRNSRWAGRYDEQLEHSLIYSLKLLRRSIFTWTRQPWSFINPCLYLAPFLDVVRSDETGAPITGTALSTVYKILTSEVFDLKTSHVDEAMHAIVESVTSCRFEVTDPASEEAVLMKILQVLLACIISDMGSVLSHRDVCNVVNTCFRVVHQSGSKSELLQRVARHTMHELVRAIFSHLAVLDTGNDSLVPYDSVDPIGYIENGDAEVADKETGLLVKISDEAKSKNGGTEELTTIEPYGVPCIVEVFHFLCSLLNMVQPYGMSEGLGGAEDDLPQFALGLINSAIECAGQSFGHHPKLIGLVQDELFRNLMQMGLSNNAVTFSLVCSIVLNLYHHLRSHIKLQLEAFFNFVVIRLAQGKYGSSYQQQEVSMETLVDFCRQPSFMPEMYANFDCDITCNNTFEDLANLLSKSAFPVNCPLSAMHVLALEGLLAIIHSMADRADSISGPMPEPSVMEIEAYTPFWNMRCDNYTDPNCWVEFVRRQKFIKRRLMIGADHFNRDPKKGLEFLQGIHLLPDQLDPESVASFFRYTTGLDKNLLGDFLGDRDDFCLRVLAEFTRTFDFSGTSLDAALRTFLESFRLPGESQKIERILDEFSMRYFEQCGNGFGNKDAILVLAYSVIMLNTDQHKPQVKKKMSEEDFIRNLRASNNGSDFPRDILSTLFNSVAKNEIRISYDVGVGVPEMTYSRWLDLIRRARKTSPYISCDTRPFLDHDMFAIMSGPTIAAISVVFDHAEDEEVLRACVDGFLAVAKISASHHLEDILDDLVVSLCKFTTLLNPVATMDEPVLAFGEDSKARMAAVTVFTIANKYGDFIRNGWRNILDCILRLHKLGLLPSRVTSDAADDTDAASDTSSQGKLISGGLSIPSAVSVGVRRRSSGLMSRFSQLLSLESDEPRSQPSEQQLAAHQRILQTIEACHIDNIFSESKFLQAESLLHLAKALIWAAGRPQKGTSSPEDEDTAVFCLELLIAITLNNRDRIMLLWQGVYEHMAGIVQTTTMPSLLVEKAVFGLLRICQRLLPYKENLAEELLRSLQLILKLDARVADAFCERITQEVTQLVRANAGHIKSPMGWRTISSLLSITARHPDASESGFEALYFIMHDGAHLTPANYVLCLDAARAFAETRVGGVERSLKALDLLAELVNSLVKWSQVASGESEKGDESREDSVKASQELAEMWIRLAQGLRRVCGEQREEVRNCAILSLQRCLSAAESLHLPALIWTQCFDQVIFLLLDELLEIALRHSPKDYRGMEGTLHLAMKFLSKIFLQFLDQLSVLPNFRALWLGILNRMETYMKARPRGKHSDKLQELIPELLRNMLLVMHSRGVLVQGDSLGGDNLWELTWHHVQSFCPSLQPDMFGQNVVVAPDAAADAAPVAVPPENP